LEGGEFFLYLVVGNAVVELELFLAWGDSAIDGEF
jgi:hypothetical protein